MRPVLLEMDGFAAFREATTVDFRGVEYFVLVGPTGSGKSTVIDAMTFALYGTVPRWDDRKSVQSALAPTVNRGTVRLVFDVGPHRYVAARELRRAAKGNVGVKNARLERLADPTGTGAAGEDTEVLAADREVSRAVEALLGLSFEHFCTCVVLPQGDFAQFMHASPADRQKILTRLLGIGVYETIAKQAGIRATGQQQRADLLAEQLTGYADVTAEAAATADLRVADLAALAERLGRHLADLAAAQAQLDDAFQVVSRLSEERELLAGVAVPPGIADLDGRRRQARQAADRSREQLTEAETADHATRDRRAAAPARGPLEQARRDHAELANTLAAESDARPRHEQSVADLDAASREAAAARADLDAAREAHATAGDNVTATRDTVTRLTAEHRLLTGLRAPDGLDALAERLAAAGHDRARAQAEMAAAESADTAVRAALSAAPPRGPLEQAHRDHAELAAALTELPAHEERLATTRTRLAAADATVTQAEGRLEHARAALDAAVRADLAGTLRLHLVAGAPCPVCDQDVAAPPAALQAAGLGAAETAVAASEGELARARDSALLAAGANHEAAAAADAARTHVARLREALAGAPPTAAAVDQQLATLDRLAAAATAADARLRAAHRSMDTAAAAGEAAAVEAAAAARALSAARDPLVHLGAPPLDGDPRTGWATLTAWARDLAAEHAQQLAAATGRAASASLAADAAHQSLKAATERAEHTQQAETATARAEQRARTDLDHLLTRARQLREALAAAPTDEQATAELARIDLLDTAALAADQARRAAQAAREAADHAAAQADREADTARTALQAARDPLVRLGAPVTTADNLLDAWTALATWADGQRAGRDAALPAAHDAAAGLKTALGVRRDGLAADLAAHGVTYPTTAPLTEVATPAAAAALERARGEQARIAERREQAAALDRDRATAQKNAHVAGKLASLLRSNQFPRWLVASALDTLVADASVNLAELSGGQYELTHDDGRFEIIDHADADSLRPVKTLSGGETFQASLALALALSAQLSTLAAAGAARLDSIFLDEGFGTLDESTLDVVASTLENLAAGGTRMVGIITHVSTLAERVPVRFTVTRDQHTSTVNRDDT